MIFDIRFKDSRVEDGYTIAGMALRSPEMMVRLKDVVKFTYTSHSPQKVVENFEKTMRAIKDGIIPPVKVTSYFEENENVIATTFSKTPGIFVNRNGIEGRTVYTFIENGAHEWCHQPLGYSHGTNHPPGSWKGWIRGDRADKNMSVPHTIARLALQVAKEKGLIK